jgi:hypothetical protein
LPRGVRTWSYDEGFGHDRLDRNGERGLPAEVCLRATGLAPGGLLDPATEITADQELRLIRNILEGLGDPPGLGLDAGLRYHLSSYGIWGFALLSSPTFRSAAQIAVRYLDLSYAFARYRLENRGRDLLITLDDNEVPDDVRQFLVECDFAAWANAAWEMRPGGFPAISAQFRFKRPEYAWRFDRLCGVRPAFDAALNAILLPAKPLDAQPASTPGRGGHFVSRAARRSAAHAGRGTAAVDAHEAVGDRRTPRLHRIGGLSHGFPSLARRVAKRVPAATARDAAPAA